MAQADFEDGRWYLDPAARFRVWLPPGWRMGVAQDMGTFWVIPPSPGPGDLRLALVSGDGVEGVRGSEVVRAAAETRPGVRISEGGGCVWAAYVRKVGTPFGEELQYLWEIGADAWVAIWSYVIDSQLRLAPGVALEFQAVAQTVGSFRFTDRVTQG